MRLSRGIGFSLVEVVITLGLLTILASVGATFYATQASRAKEDAATAKLAEIREAIQRWQVENNRIYPYDDLRPIIGTHIENLGPDPWGSEYRVDPTHGIIYSLGPNQVDEHGTGGDDIALKYGVAKVSEPLPPTNVAAALASGGVNLTWKPPAANADGTPLATGALDKWWYEVLRTSRDIPPASAPVNPGSWAGPIPGTSVGATWRQTIPFGGTSMVDPIGSINPQYAYYYLFFTHHSLPTSQVLTSGPSNSAGIFVPQQTQPHIVTFAPTSNPVPLGAPFAFDIDVEDPSSGLTSITLDFNGSSKTWTAASGDISNPFKFQMSYTPTNTPATPQLVNGVRLTVHGGYDPTSKTAGVFTTSAPPAGLPPLSINFTNHAPIITSLRPSFTSFVVGPNTTKAVDFTVEARDDDGNLTQVSIGDGQHPSVVFNEPKVFSAVERVSWVYNCSTTQTIVVSATASDSVGANSIAASGLIAISADTTPPITPVVDLSASNTIMATDPSIVSTWTIPTLDKVAVHWESYDPETPPVSFKALISTVDPTQNTSGALANAMTQTHTGQSGWSSPVTTQDYVLTFKTDGSGDLKQKLVEGTTYFMAVQAVNAGGLANPTLVPPTNRRTGLPQSPFLVDATPPRVNSFTLDSSCDPNTKPLALRPNLTPAAPTAFNPVWTKGGSVTGGWNVADYGPTGNFLTSNPNDFLINYNIYELFNTAANRTILSTNPAYLGTRIGGGNVKSTRFAFVIPPLDAAVLNTARMNVTLRARDIAGNWSPYTTRTAVLDMFPPQFQGAPSIVSSGGVITNPQQLTMQFTATTTAGTVPIFGDLESGTSAIRDFWKWEIVVPGATRNSEEVRAFGTVQRFPQDIAFLSPSLGNGDLVFLRVTGFDCVGNASLPSTSPLVRVDTSLEPTLVACPARSFFGTQVQFTSTVTGGGPFYSFTLAPNVALDAGSPIDMAAGCLVLGSNQAASRTTATSEVCSFTMNRAGDVSDHVEARVTVQSFPDATSQVVVPAFQASAILSVLPQPYALVGNASQNLLELIDLSSTSRSPIVTYSTDPGTTVIDMKIDPTSTHQFALVLSPAVLTRVDLATGQTTDLFSPTTAASTFKHLAIAQDGSFCLVSVVQIAGATHQYARVFLNNGFASGSPNMIPTTPTAGLSSGVAIAPDGSFALAADATNHRVEKMSQPSSATPGISTLVSLTAASTPDLIAISPNASTAAVAPSAGSTLTHVNLLTLNQTRFTMPEPVAQGLTFTSDSAFSIVALADKVVRFPTLTGAQTSGSPLGTSALTDVRLAFNDSFGLAPDAASASVNVLQTTTDSSSCGGLPPLVPPAAFGARLRTINVTPNPGPVRFIERPKFGLPAVTAVSPTTVDRGSALQVNGLNLNSGVNITIGGVGQTINSSNGFNQVNITVSPGTPTGSGITVSATNQFGVAFQTVTVIVN